MSSPTGPDAETRASAHWSEQRLALGLPESSETLFDAWHRPFADALARWHTEAGAALIVGVQGCQGAGKSTLCALVPALAQELHGLRVAVLALDDIYLPRRDREHLSQTCHPLWQTRGVPGTHDPVLGAILLERLRTSTAADLVRLPVFDKGLDDRLPADCWREIAGPFDVIIFEGWCMGIRAGDISDWAEPVNDLEANEDSDGRWRGRIERQLLGPYATLFGLLDRLAVMQVPSWETVALWRGEQEAKLRASRREGAPRSLDTAQLARFLAHYERLTRAMIANLPGRADLLAIIAEDRSISSVATR